MNQVNNSIIEFELVEYAVIENKIPIKQRMMFWKKHKDNSDILNLTRKICVLRADIKYVMQHRETAYSVSKGMCVVNVSGDEYVVKGSYKTTIEKIYGQKQIGY